MIIRLIIHLKEEKVFPINNTDSKNVIKLRNINFNIDFSVSVTMLRSFQTLPRAMTHEQKDSQVVDLILWSGMFREENHGNVSGIPTLKIWKEKKKKMCEPSKNKSANNQVSVLLCGKERQNVHELCALINTLIAWNLISVQRTNS